MRAPRARLARAPARRDRAFLHPRGVLFPCLPEENVLDLLGCALRVVSVTIRSHGWGNSILKIVASSLRSLLLEALGHLLVKRAEPELLRVGDRLIMQPVKVRRLGLEPDARDFRQTILQIPILAGGEPFAASAQLSKDLGAKQIRADMGSTLPLP